MRELKFRAWDKENNMFHYSDHMTMVDFWQIVEENLSFPVDQFTGLHCKDGKEIYEGDRVDLQGGYLIGDIFSGQSRDFQGVVEFIEGRFVVNCKEDEVIFELQKEYHVAVVIGNIHEEGAE